MLDDLTKTVKAQLYERANSPLFGAFALAWCVWNYKFLLIVFSTMPAVEKIGYIDAVVFATPRDILLRGVFFPLASALVFIYAYPVPAKVVFEYWRTRQKELKAVQQRIEDETPLTKEEARELRRQALKAEQEFEEELAARANEITRLREIIAKSDVTPAVNATLALESLPTLGVEEKLEPQLEVRPESKESSLDTDQIDILEKIASYSEPISDYKLVRQSTLDKVEAEYAIDEILRLDLATQYHDPSGDRLIGITPNGRKFIVQHRRLVRKGEPVELAH